VSQSLRNKIYGVVAGVFGLLVVLGAVDQATSDEATSLATAALDLAEPVIGLVTALLAFVKSLPSRVTVIDKPKHAVES